MDWTVIFVGILSLLGTTIGSLAGIRASNKLVDHRLKCLEAKVDKHNHLVERMTAVEQSAKSAHHRIGELRDEFDKVI